MGRLRLRLPIHWVLDWDGTLTHKDTMSILSRIAEQRDLRLAVSSSICQRVIESQWTSYGRSYVDDYNRHKAAYIPKASEGTTIQAEKDWLASLKDVEYGSATRVAEDCFLQGVKGQDVDAAAANAIEERQVEMRTGWMELFESLRSRPEVTSQTSSNKISILSVNWSATLIKRVLWHAADSWTDHHGIKAATQDYITHMDVVANEIEGLEDPEGSSGTLTGDIRTSADKMRYMPVRDSSMPTVVYVGDSATDLECFLTADVGICIRDEAMGSGQRELADTLDRTGVNVKHITEDVQAEQTETLWWAKDFNEILSCIER